MSNVSRLQSMMSHPSFGGRSPEQQAAATAALFTLSDVNSRATDQQREELAAQAVAALRSN